MSTVIGFTRRDCPIYGYTFRTVVAGDDKSCVLLEISSGEWQCRQCSDAKPFLCSSMPGNTAAILVILIGIGGVYKNSILRQNFMSFVHNCEELLQYSELLRNVLDSFWCSVRYTALRL